MPQSQVTFVSHEKVEGSSPKGPWTLNIFKTADGFSASTLKALVAQQALSTLNQPVVADYFEREPGKFSLNSIQAVNGSGAVVADHSQPQVAPATSAVAAPVLTPTPKPDTSTAERIARSHALTTAMKAIEMADGDAELAKDILTSAVKLAYIPAFFTYGDKTVTQVVPSSDGEGAADTAAAPAEPTI